ncbi:UNVERIFIED_CONTAM: Transcription factor MUTE [Sesamum latifolium]|uniref:Transcription factor MUTE n=1 Tax=Sesamum latifolium TaxID=2727402 RepID=A0AAW2XSX0_9LAMI
MSHIAVERNRRRQMNEHLKVLRSLTPCFYIKRGDQASIIGGVIEFIKELHQVLQSLEAKKRRKSLSPSPGPSPRQFQPSPQLPDSPFGIQDNNFKELGACCNSSRRCRSKDFRVKRPPEDYFQANSRSNCADNKCLGEIIVRNSSLEHQQHGGYCSILLCHQAADRVGVPSERGGTNP